MVQSKFFRRTTNSSITRTVSMRFPLPMRSPSPRLPSFRSWSGHISQRSNFKWRITGRNLWHSHVHCVLTFHATFWSPCQSDVGTPLLGHELICKPFLTVACQWRLKMQWLTSYKDLKWQGGRQWGFMYPLINRRPDVFHFFDLGASCQV